MPAWHGSSHLKFPIKQPQESRTRTLPAPTSPLARRTPSACWRAAALPMRVQPGSPLLLAAASKRHPVHGTGASSEARRPLRSHSPSRVTRSLSRVLGPPRPAMPAPGECRASKGRLRFPAFNRPPRAPCNCSFTCQPPLSGHGAHPRNCSCRQTGGPRLGWWRGCRQAMLQRARRGRTGMW